jgi:2-oxoglutarate dehydrogenase E1 component
MENGETDAKTLAKEMEQQFLADLQERLDEVKQNPLPYTYQQPELVWKSLRKATAEDFDASPITAITEDLFTKVYDGLMKWPEGFKPLRKVDKLIQDKLKLFADEKKIDWATAELMAYGTMLAEGKDEWSGC